MDFISHLDITGGNSCRNCNPAVLQSGLIAPAGDFDKVPGHWAKLGLLGGLASLVAEAPAHCPRLLLPPPVVTHWSGLKVLILNK